MDLFERLMSRYIETYFLINQTSLTYFNHKAVGDFLSEEDLFSGREARDIISTFESDQRHREFLEVHKFYVAAFEYLLESLHLENEDHVSLHYMQPE